jgi:alcohol dehydrogenase class IV
MSHALGGLKDLALHHGTLNAVLLPTVLRFNEEVVGFKYPRIVAALGQPEGTDLAAWIEDLNRRLGMPRGLEAMGVTQDRLDAIATLAVKDHTNLTNPRPAGVEDYKRMLATAM